MKNTLKVTIPFSFKGIVHEPSITLDLDKFSQENSNFDAIHSLVARENNIDSYSYEYEVLESSPLIFSEPTGIARDFLNDNVFDLAGFIEKQKTTEIDSLLQKIAADTIGDHALQDNPQLKEALWKAYQAGQAVNHAG